VFGFVPSTVNSLAQGLRYCNTTTKDISKKTCIFSPPPEPQNLTPSESHPLQNLRTLEPIEIQADQAGRDDLALSSGSFGHTLLLNPEDSAYPSFVFLYVWQYYVQHENNH
jgi:hypothetical protein